MPTPPRRNTPERRVTRPTGRDAGSAQEDGPGIASGSQRGGGEDPGGRNPRRVGGWSLHDHAALRPGNEALKGSTARRGNAGPEWTPGRQGPGNRHPSGSGREALKGSPARCRAEATAGRSEERGQVDAARGTSPRPCRAGTRRARACARGPERKPQESHRGCRNPRGGCTVQTRKTGRRPGRTSVGTANQRARTQVVEGSEPRPGRGATGGTASWRELRHARPAPNGAGNGLTSDEERAGSWTRRSRDPGAGSS
jgi:hypothetical protein